MNERKALVVDSEEGDNSSLTQRPTQSQSSNLDPILFNDLVQIVPLVHSLIDHKGSSSFTRQGSMIFTKRPSREWLSNRITALKGRKALTSEKEKLKENVDELRKKLLEKDKLIESAENSRSQINTLNEKLDELKNQASEKDSLLKSTKQQLFDVKLKLADKQAALEKINWQVMTSNQKVEKLQEEIDSMQGDISSITMLLEGLTKTDTTEFIYDYDIKPYDFNHLPGIDDLDNLEMQKMEEARKAYKAAVTAAKEKQNEDSIATAASARLHLQSMLLKTVDFHLIILLVLFQMFTRWALY